MGDGLDGRTLKMIRHAIAAGGLRQGAVKWPEAASRLCKAADAHTARAGTLADEICAGIGAGTPVRAPLPHTKR